MNKILTKKTITLATIVITLGICSIIASCQQDEMGEEANTKEWIYLSVDTSKNASEMSTDELKIVIEAFRRLNILEKDGLFHIMQSASELNISEDLFALLKTTVGEMNERIISSKIDISTPRTRTNEEGGNGGKNDCVAHTISAVSSSFGRYTSVNSISTWIENKYGNDGVPLNAMGNVLNHYFHSNLVPIPAGYSHDFRNPTNQVIAVIEQGWTAHAVTVLAIQTGTLLYRDDQNSSSWKTCSTVYIRATYRIEGVR